MTDLRAGAPEEGGAFDAVEHPQRRAYLRALAVHGQGRRAAREAGVHFDTPYSRAWLKDQAFQEALPLARRMAAEAAEDQAFRRATEGLRRVQFNNKSGEPLRDPDWCECGRPRKEHVRDRGAPLGRGPHPDNPECEGFHPRVYVEHEFSDRLLEVLLRGNLRERYGDRLEVTNRALARLDVRLLPDAALAALQATGGDVMNVLAVLARLIGEGGPEAESVRRAVEPTGLLRAGGEVVQSFEPEGDS